VTGALLFNSSYFAQALEGPKLAIEQIFEKIQRDPRHGEVTVLSSQTGGQRDFPEWSMAHVAPPDEAASASMAVVLDTAFVASRSFSRRSTRSAAIAREFRRTDISDSLVVLVPHSTVFLHVSAAMKGFSLG